MPGANFAGKRGDFDAGGEEPGIIMALESFAVGVAKKGCAVSDFGGDFGFGANGLVVGDECEPLAEGDAIGGVG